MTSEDQLTAAGKQGHGVRATNIATKRAKAIAGPRQPMLKPMPSNARPAEPAKDCSITIVGLKDGVCHFPLWGDIEYPVTDRSLYCGAPSGIKVYCEAHTTLTAPVDARRR